MTRLCLECSARPARLACGVCWSCFQELGDDLDTDYADRPLPLWPTDALPGSPEKLAVLEERAQSQESLFHPGDARLTDVAVLDMPAHLRKRSGQNGQPPGRWAECALRVLREAA